MHECAIERMKHDEMTLTLDSPITEDQWDIISDVDFEHTNRIWFHTKHGKEVEFVKRKTGKWLNEKGIPVEWGEEHGDYFPAGSCTCSECGKWLVGSDEYSVYAYFCPYCGSDMRQAGGEE